MRALGLSVFLTGVSRMEAAVRDGSTPWVPLVIVIRLLARRSDLARAVRFMAGERNVTSHSS
jgi:hypothetical protein